MLLRLCFPLNGTGIFESLFKDEDELVGGFIFVTQIFLGKLFFLERKSNYDIFVIISLQ